MANGDAAAAAGMDVVPSTAPAKKGYDEINKTRDYIAQRTSAVTPITKGGTGASDAVAARTNLSVPSTSDLATGLAGKSPVGHTHNFPQIGPGQMDNGGYPATFGPTRVAAGLTVDTTASIGGRITNPTGRNSTVGSWVSLGIDPSGNIGVGASSRRFKKEIRDWSPDVQAAYAMRLVQYRYKVAVIQNSPVEHGVIAEELLELGLDWLVVFDDEGEPFSVRYELIALLAIEAVQDLNDRVSALEARL